LHFTDALFICVQYCTRLSSKNGVSHMPTSSFGSPLTLRTQLRLV
jgi:hypothetical protein